MISGLRRASANAQRAASLSFKRSAAQPLIIGLRRASANAQRAASLSSKRSARSPSPTPGAGLAAPSILHDIIWGGGRRCAFTGAHANGAHANCGGHEPPPCCQDARICTLGRAGCFPSVRSRRYNFRCVDGAHCAMPKLTRSGRSCGVQMWGSREWMVQNGAGSPVRICTPAAS